MERDGNLGGFNYRLIPSYSARLMWNWFRSSKSRLRPRSMNASNFTVNCAMELRKSSNPKLMLGNESAIDGASAEARGGRMPLVESDGSNEEVISDN